MRWLTGPDRAAYESLVAQNAKLLADVAGLERQATTLEGVVRKWFDLWKYERDRADNAVDSLLLSRGLAPVTPEGPLPPEEPDPFAVDEDARARWIKEHGLVDSRG